MKVHYIVVHTNKSMESLVNKLRNLNSTNITATNITFSKAYSESSVIHKLQVIAPTLKDIDSIVIIRQTNLPKSFFDVVVNSLKNCFINTKVSEIATNENDLSVLLEDTNYGRHVVIESGMCSELLPYESSVVRSR